jgi:hypothetical protein
MKTSKREEIKNKEQNECKEFQNYFVTFFVNSADSLADEPCTLTKDVLQESEHQNQHKVVKMQSYETGYSVADYLRDWGLTPQSASPTIPVLMRRSKGEELKKKECDENQEQNECKEFDNYSVIRWVI